MRLNCVVTLVALAMCARAAFSGALPVPTSPADGATVAIHTAKQSAYLSKSMVEREAIGKDRVQHSALTKTDDPRWAGVDHAGTFPQPVTLSWTGEGPFTVEIRRASDNKVVFTATDLAANSVDVFNFEIGCAYSWTVGNASGGSSSATFTTDNVFPRLLWDRDPEGRIYGVRELGGCFVSNGAYRVRQGLVFRSSKLNDNATGTTPGASFVSDSNRSTWLNDFGVRYELDLRGGSGEAGSMTASPLGGTVTYKHISGVDYGITDSAANKTAIKNELDYALDPAHYPLVFHCSIGHDRTGTLAFLMHGLLGVSEDDILRNYEASWFWYCKGTDSGVAGHYSGIDRIRTALAAYPGATMADRVVAYCKSIGITDAQIAAFRAAMLEPVGGEEPPVEPDVDPTEYGAADTSAITYVWKGGSAPWMYTTSWTPSRTPCHGIPDAKVAVVQFPALDEASSVTLRDVGVNVRRMDFANTAALELELDNGRITVAAGTSADKTTVEIGKTGPATVTFKGANPQIKTLSEYANGRLIFGADAAVPFTTTLAFVLPAKTWTAQTAPILSAGTDSPLRFHPNVRFAVDATALGALAAGTSVTNVLAYNNDGVRVSDASILESAELTCPNGTTGEILKIGGTLSFVLSGPAKEPPQPPAPPEQETEPDDYWASTPFPAANTVICYGDSITYGEKGASLVVPDAPNYFDGRLAGRTGIDNYPYRLSTLLPAEYNVIAQAKSGKTADAIMSWAGGVPVRSVCDVTLPAAANENVAMPQNFLYYGTDPGGQYKNTGNAAYYGLLTPVVPLIEPLIVSSGDSLTGWFGGVHVRIGGNHADERVICRTDAGEGPVTVPAGTRFFPDNAITYRDAIKVICAGTNDGVARRETYVSQIEDGVTNTPSSRYVVLSPYQSEFLAGESQDQATPTETERLFAARFGEHCVNTRLALKERGLGIAVRLGLMTQAEADVAIWNDTKTGKGLMPVGDATHLNSTGYAVLAYLVKEKLLALGYVNEPEPPEPSAEREFPEKLVFTGATSKDGLYFITDYVPNLATTRLEMKFRLNDVTGQSSGLFAANGLTAGKAEAGNGTRVEYYYNKNGRTPWLNYTCGGAKVDVSGFNDTKDFHVLVAEGGSFLLDGIAYATEGDLDPGGLADGPLVIAAMMLGSNSYYNFPKMELAYFKVSERRGDGTYRLVHDYRPGTNSSGEATLYDLVSQTCLTPTAAGTGNKALAAGGGTVGVDVVGPVVDGSRSGDSVVPVGFDAGDFRIAADGRTLTCGSSSYSKPHYVFAGTANGGIVVRIDPDEATIAGLGFDAAGNAVITMGKAFEDFRYRVEHAESLPFGDFDATAYQVLGSDQALTVPRIGSRRLYRVRVIDQW